MRITALLATSFVVASVSRAEAQATVHGDSTRRDSARTLETVTVNAIRARDAAPVSAKTLDAHEVEQRSFGQDMPLLLQGTPSLTSYSETGNYWGYSYIRMRGIDQSRINLTLDGIPLNDPEDQVLYFTDFPDLANSINSVQVQRGVGTSAPGTASYGGSINFQTVPVVTTPRSAQVQLQGGSFGTARASGEFATGLHRGFAAYGRVSALQSKGYRRHSGTAGRSAFVSAAWAGERDVVKLTALAGLFEDTLAYVGASTTELAQDRRFNPLRRDELDRFGEQIAALSYTRYLTGGTSASVTAYRTSASGNYDVCISNCDQPQGDLWNFGLDFVWYGATAAWTIDRAGVRASAGVNANTYARDHSAFARPDLATPLYLNTGHKSDGSAFAKLEYDVGTLTLFGDLQGRRAEFRYSPDVNAAIPGSSIAWSFLNPKAGVTLRVRPSLTFYASYGVNSREPARGDMLAGFDNLDTSNVAFVGPLDRVRPEHARDLELGVKLRRARWSLDANAFAMDFRDEILAVGRLSYIGTPLRTNVRASERRGVELDAEARPWDRVQLALTATAMRARIADYTDDETGLSYHGVEPLLTPRFVTSERVSVDATRSLTVSVVGRSSSRAQLNNTGDPALRLPACITGDASVDWHRGNRGVTLYLNNVTNAQRYGSGHVSAGEARYYVLPPRNVFLLARIGT
jgi:iron complex outermembrane receptor protein